MSQDTSHSPRVEHLDNGITHTIYSVAPTSEGLEAATQLSAEAIVAGGHPCMTHLIPFEVPEGTETDQYQGCDVLLVACGHIATWEWFEATSHDDAVKLATRFATMLLLITGELDPQSALNAFAVLPKVDPHQKS